MRVAMTSNRRSTIRRDFKEYAKESGIDVDVLSDCYSALCWEGELRKIARTGCRARTLIPDGARRRLKSVGLLTSTNVTNKANIERLEELLAVCPELPKYRPDPNDPLEDDEYEEPGEYDEEDYESTEFEFMKPPATIKL
jgi:hypothetical protein